MPKESDSSIQTRRSLLHRLKDWEDNSSWKDFFETYWKLIYGVARKAGLNDPEAQDVVQETIIAVARKMPDVHYDPAIGTFKAWLMRLTRWRITDHLRKATFERKGERHPREVSAEPTFIEAQPDVAGLDLDAVWEEEWKAQLTEAALARVRDQVSPRQFQIFYLHVCKNIPVREVARDLRIPVTRVYFAKYKVAAAVRREVARMEKQML